MNEQKKNCKKKKERNEEKNERKTKRKKETKGNILEKEKILVRRREEP